jgi:aryl-alcohol dehydrogenase-like predicted oxidoreductase
MLAWLYSTWLLLECTMKYHTLGNSDLNVSEICLGTMTFGEQNSADDARILLDYALSCGVNFIDTAEMYPVPPRAETCRRTEDYIGRWLKSQARDKLVVATKVTGPARGFDWIRGGPSVTRRHIEEAIDGSLCRLQTDYIDLYQIHWPDRNVPMFGQSTFDVTAERDTTPIAEQLAALGNLVKAGKIRYVGLSNETPWGVCEFVRIAEQAGLPRVVSIQNAYNLINRVFEYGLSETCYRENIGLLAYSPLAFGSLSGKYLSGGSGRMTLFPGFGQRYNKPNVNEAVGAYCALALETGVTPATLALAFVRSRQFVASTIIGATSMVQLKENIDSTMVELSAAVLQEIATIHARYADPAP